MLFNLVRRLFLLSLVIFSSTAIALDVEVTSSLDPLEDGTNLTFTLTVSNPDNVTRNNVVLDATTPGYMFIYNSQVTAGGTCLASACSAGDTIRWQLGDLAPGEVRTAQFSDTVSTVALDGALVTADAVVYADGVSSAHDSHSAVVTENDPALQLEVFPDQQTVSWGGEATLTLTYYNLSTSLTADQIFAKIPTGTSFVSATGGGTKSGEFIRWRISAGPGSNGVVEYTLKVTGNSTAGSLIRADAVLEENANGFQATAASVITVETNTPFVLSNDIPYWDSRDPAGPAVQLRWKALAGATHYEVYRDSLKIYPANGKTYFGLSFTNELGLISGQTYDFYVLAKNSTDTWHSNIVSVGPMPSEPGLPSLATAFPGVINQGNSYQEVTLTGSSFTTLSWHQFSIDGGATWFMAQSAPILVDENNMVVAVNDTLARTVMVRVCASFGSNDCSGSQFIIIQPANGIVPIGEFVTPSTIALDVGDYPVKIRGGGFAAGNAYQVSFNGGSWSWSTLPPLVVDSHVMTVDVPNTTLGEVSIRVCVEQGSSTCSGSVMVNVAQPGESALTLESVLPTALEQGASELVPVTLTGAGITSAVWHQLSDDGGSTWVWAALEPAIHDDTSMTVRLNDSVARTMLIRACTYHGSGLCSGSLSVKIEPSAQERDPVMLAPTGARNAVLITHGWNADADSWVKEMSEAICSYLMAETTVGSVFANGARKYCHVDGSAENPGWDVWVYDWRDDAILDRLWKEGDGHIPTEAYLEAPRHGEAFHSLIKSQSYEHIYFIGHSAGSNLIETAARALRAERGPGISIHQTFLDPYVPRGIDTTPTKISRYGRDADWVDSYHDLRGPPRIYLTNGYNVDVTGETNDCDYPVTQIFTGLACKHSRPYRYYGVTVSDDYIGWPEFMAADFIQTDPPVPLGFDLSVETDKTLEDLAFNYPKDSLCKVFDSTCIEIPDPLSSLVMGSVAIGAVAVQVANGAWDLLIGTGNKVQSFILDAAGHLFGGESTINLSAVDAIEDVLFADGFEQGNKLSEATAFLNISVTTDGPVNVLRFSWSFGEQGEGILRVFFDGVLIRQIDQRHVDLASFEPEELLIGTAEGALPTGSHEIVFRLDSYDSVNPASMRITDVELGFIEVIELTVPP